MDKYAVEDKGKGSARVAALLGAGLLIGVINGFFGGGGGMLLVPALGWLLKTSVKQSHATAIAVILPLSAVSAAVYLLKGVEITSTFTPVTAGVIAGGIAGALLLKKLSSKALSLVFYLLMVVAGVKMIVG